MNLKDTLGEELKNALKSGDKVRSRVLRFLLAQLHNREIEKRGAGQEPALADDEILQVFQKEAKRRREAIELFRKGGRQDIVEKEEQELAVIDAYLPKALSRDELAQIVDELLKSGLTDFNSLMRETMKRAAGRAEGRAVGEIVRARLG